MEIIIGSIPPLAQQQQKGSKGRESGPAIPAQLLHVRPPRKGIAGPSGMERRKKLTNDPHRGRVLTVLVPDGRLLPADIESGSYDVILRFTPRQS
ncbi:MAG: hypothetical protein ACN4GW_09395 [Desulforhopalus sp.]